MGAFEFFFSLYGLVLGLSVAVLATGVATAIQHRRAIHRGAPFGYALPIGGSAAVPTQSYAVARPTPAKAAS